MDVDEQRLQREGYVAALRAPALHGAVAAGARGRIAVAYMEWAGEADQQVVVPFTIIDGAAAALAFADRLAAAPLGTRQRTSISDAIAAATRLIEEAGFAATRRVIDISGDGPNNAGAPVTHARAAALARGVTINGLPLLLKRPGAGGWGDMEHLDIYYEDCVIGGPGAFALAVRERSQFVEATRRKLLLEIAAPAQSAARLAPASADAPRVDCLIGERMRRQWEH
jgi:hypothetical protein